jgi:hypothetical protein
VILAIIAGLRNWNDLKDPVNAVTTVLVAVLAYYFGSRAQRDG